MDKLLIKSAFATIKEGVDAGNINQDRFGPEQRGVHAALAVAENACIDLHRIADAMEVIAQHFKSRP